ncbi:MAG: hypothetical protein JO307_21010 [Bryobacterales bacterium]|nr:hypothetical protein [Bryobacterales bacterium]
MTDQPSMAAAHPDRGGSDIEFIATSRNQQRHQGWARWSVSSASNMRCLAAPAPNSKADETNAE